MYTTWGLYIAPKTSPLLTIVFLSSSAFLWFYFIKSWKGDPGVIAYTQEEKFRVSFWYHSTVIIF